ncbi:unnamed protein product [Candida verbasci]|uniref:Protein kinase domain-containing protein n=1 Tax=Candida verbasci TaxID=1227364 RepID=A0A9W4XDT1_9ASCO|nr:unnamed protein product [Candida verbasci]
MSRFRPWNRTFDKIIENPKYIINKNPIGDGTYSVVFRCQNKLNEKHYAAKKYNKRLVFGLEEMLTSEFEILKQLSKKHPHILSLMDYFETEDSYYLVTDLADGGDLFNKILSNDWKLEESIASEITLQLVKAVQCLHANNLIPRDIKAENVFFQNKHTHNILLGDFGLARLLKNGEKLYDVSGTLSYMAPEMFDRSVGYDFPVDIWAIGVVVYFMLSGYMPFDWETDDETKEAIKEAKYLFEPVEY